jgi:hypothetical protein
LSKENIPRAYIIKTLREISGRKKLPLFDIRLDKSILLELPTVMRLELLESLMKYTRCKINFKEKISIF